jgi:diguanylate cyclase (GGDEF)-like protein
LQAFAAADANGSLADGAVLTTLLELAETGCAVLDTACGMVLAANSAARRLIGSELQGLPAGRLLAGPGRGRRLEAWHSELTRRPQGSWQLELRRCNGQRLPVTMSYERLGAGAGSLLLLSLRQGPLLQRLHDELEQNRLLLTEVQRLGRIGSWDHNHRDDRLHWSEEVGAIFRSPAGQWPINLAGMRALMHPEDRLRVEETIRRAQRLSRPWEVSYRVGRDGDHVSVIERGETRSDADGRPLLSHGTVQELTDLEEVRQELRRSNSLDELTGLPNRAACTRRLAALLRQHPQPQEVAVLDLDVDEFQTINESFGMATGNQLLSTVAERLSENLTPGDLVGRIGSDEFLVVRSGIGSAREASALAEELQQRLGAPHRLDEHFSVRAPVSVGVSVGPLHSSDAVGLLQCANTALAAAKQRGRQELEVYSSELSQRIQERLRLEQELARAIDRHQLRLDYQPQVDGDGRLVGAEALLRWRNSRGETISPARFIPMAEATGLIVAIGAWVVEEGFRQLAEWRRQGLHLPRLALNLSPRQFNGSDNRLLEIVESSCRSHRLDPAGVEFELTETGFQGEMTPVKRQLEELAGQGFQLAIDDFGTGYSSLGMLHQLPLNTLKIDRCFVRDLVEHGPGRSIVGATLAMAGQLGLSTVAEGVETDEQLRQLKQLGCSEFQGFLFSRPLPARDLEELLSQPDRPLLKSAISAAGRC